MPDEQPTNDNATQQPAPTTDGLSKDVSVFDDKPFEEITEVPGTSLTVSDRMYVEQRTLERAAVAMSRTGIAIQPIFREHPGHCYAILLHCAHWKIRNALFIANHAYVTEQNKYNRATKSYEKVETLAFDAQVFHAVIEASGIVEPVPEYEYNGEGDNRTCTVTYLLRGSKRPISYTSPPLSKCMPETFEKDGKRWVKGSQLWLDDPDMQQGYFSVRNLARKYLPLALAGIYDREELEYDPPPPGPDNARDVTQSVVDRLQKKGLTDQGGGFGEGRHTPAKARTKAKENKPTATTPRQATEKPAGKPKAAPAPAKPAKAASAPEPKPKPAPAEPTDLAGYRKHVKAWIEELRPEGGVALKKRWADERKLRSKIGLLSEEYGPIKELVDQAAEATS